MTYKMELTKDNKLAIHKKIFELGYFDTVSVITENGKHLDFIKIYGGWIFLMDGNQSFILQWYMPEPNEDNPDLYF